MNRVDLSAEGFPLPSWNKEAVSFIRKVLNKLGRKNWDLSVLFCGDKYIKFLNKNYRKINEATDVLSFPLGEKTNDKNGKQRYLPGDIVISLEMMKKNAKISCISADEELRRLLIHGILHLDGMDHATNKDSEPMLILQEKILKSLNSEEILCA